MENLTTIQVTEKTRNKLVAIKYKFDCESMDEVINRLLKILTHFKLADEFKEEWKQIKR